MMRQAEREFMIRVIDHHWISHLTSIDDVREGISRRLKELGFRFVTLDLEGFRSGSMNELIPLELRRQYTPQP